MACRRRSLVSCLFLSLVWLAVARSASAESLHRLRGISHRESNIDLLLEAFSHINHNQHALATTIEQLEKSLARKGERILVPVGDPPIYPEARFKGKLIKEDAHNQVRFLCVEVEAEWKISDETTHRFLLEVMSVNRRDGRVVSSSSTSMLGTGTTKRMNLGSGLIQPGKHDVLHILIARPIKGNAAAKILDVERSIVEVPKP